MADIKDVAEYVLARTGKITAMKLQKLVYYAQAWHLVWEEQPLFENRIEAWANGPVSPRLYAHHRGMFAVEPGQIGGSAESITAGEASTLDAVLNHYGSMSAMELSEITHAEDPWRIARGDTPLGERSDAEITQASMAEYYSSL